MTFYESACVKVNDAYLSQIKSKNTVQFLKRNQTKIAFTRRETVIVN